jgi:chromosome segregation protein
LDEARLRLDALEQQLARHETELLAGRQALAELYVKKEENVRELEIEMGAADQLSVERADLHEQLQAERERFGTLHAERHRLEAGIDRLRHERETLCERFQEDYGIELAATATVAGGEVTNGKPPVDLAAAEQEIAELRQQIGTIGAVNVDALGELEEIETRFDRLSTQYRDLVDAKESLERIIQRINLDSKQLFVTTLEVVRGHFQELFRRLFGGGEADIVLEDANDVLECGIEIIARPPGKEACSISLLSGGEKTLTCVALLLAVFRSKPSPFCVLDEVDAALDEANIGRFVEVLRDFLSFTRFIVVTHSRKTMAGGDTLYGVTMEETGVSKRVAVRFEDVSEDGQIRLATRRAA